MVKLEEMKQLLKFLDWVSPPLWSRLNCVNNYWMGLGVQALYGPRRTNLTDFGDLLPFPLALSQGWHFWF